MINLNEHKSTFISNAGSYNVTITAAQDDYTKGGKECVAVRFETDDNQAINCNYVEAVYWKLFRLAQAAGLTEQQRAAFEPSMLIGKSVMIKVMADEQGRCNVAEAFSTATPTAPQNSPDIPF